MKPSPLTIPTINFDELANSQLSRNAQRIANGNGSTDGYNDRFNSPSQVGSVPATGFPSLKPSAFDGRGLAGESEDEVDWDAENQRRMQMGNLDRYDTSYDRRPRVSPLVSQPIDWEQLVREQRVNDRSRR